MHAPSELLEAFRTWLAGGAGEITVEVAPGDGDRWPVPALLYELWDSTDTLPAAAAHRLGLPVPTTFGHAARMVWTLWAEDDDCHTCGEAVERLRSLPGRRRAALHALTTCDLQRDTTGPRTRRDQLTEA